VTGKCRQEQNQKRDELVQDWRDRYRIRGDIDKIWGDRDKIRGGRDRVR